MLFLVFFATLFETLCTTEDADKHSTMEKIICCFSLKRNTKRLFTLPQKKDTKDEIDFGCIHGIRVITMAWMTVNHTYLFGGVFNMWMFRKLLVIQEWPKAMWFQAIFNGWITVETFFFLRSEKKTS